MTSMVELTLSRFVLRHKLPTNAPETLTAVVSDFLIADMSVARACELSRVGSLELLDLVWTRSRRGFKSTIASLLNSNQEYYRWEFSQALVQAVRRADLAMIHWLLAHFSRCPVSGEVVREAAKGGHLWTLQLLEADRSHGGIEWCEKSLPEAARVDRWDIVKWLQAHLTIDLNWSDNYELLDIAVSQNDLERVKWVRASGFPLATIDVRHSSEENWMSRVKIIRNLLEMGRGDAAYIAEFSLSEAARLGDQGMLEWLLARNEEYPDDRDVYETILYNACDQNHLKMVQWLLANVEYYQGEMNGPALAMMTATNGRLVIVQWLWDNYSHDPTGILFECHGNTAMDCAAGNGHTEILKFLHRVGAET